MDSPRKTAMLRALKDSDPRVKEAASAALDMIEAKENLRRIFENYKTGDASAKLKAILAVRNLKEKRSLKMLLHAAGSEFPEIRAAAAETMGVLHLREGSDTLLSLLKDKEKEVVRRSARALGIMECGEAVSALTGALDCEDAETCLTLINALGLIASPDAEGALLELMENQNGKIRTAAAEAIGLLRIS